jgi:MerR family transcriptional regulator, redox-sensitive transcriptional activator SoxR
MLKLQVMSKSRGDSEDLTIGEAAARIGITTSAMRFYEDSGLIRAARTGGGQRRYHRDVLRRVAFIRGAQSIGMRLAEIRQAVDNLPGDRAPTKQEWHALSELWRPKLDAKIAVLLNIRDKLDICIGCGCQSLDSCAIFNPDDVAAAQGPGSALTR